MGSFGLMTFGCSPDGGLGVTLRTDFFPLEGRSTTTTSGAAGASGTSGSLTSRGLKAKTRSPPPPIPRITRARSSSACLGKNTSPCTTPDAGASKAES